MTDTVSAPAKLNLTLRVGGTRDDGLHRLASAFTILTLTDRLEFRLSPLPGVTLSGAPAEIDPLGNTLSSAWRAFRERAELHAPGVRVELDKRIPIASGLGGGSSDAAALLSWLNEQAGQPLTDDELAEAGFEVGADVPLFLSGAPQGLMQGAGEQISPADFELPGHVLLVVPALEKSTAELYRRLDEQGLDRDRLPEPNLDNPLAEVRDDGLLVNDFLPLWEGTAVGEIAGVLAELTRSYAISAGLTGSGPTLFALAESGETLNGVTGKLLDRVRKLGVSFRMVRTQTA